ncbi:helix-turn-helix transcriptional regulator [Archangium sp.]|uniref:helix-turn-helix domain-containing protein n=1 Tax=Archangium sp. TaxID=1872627 RepID=UPI00286B0C3F|nr:helix-turn-helix transcriptional regulator [Archangium sp.]
MPQAHKTKTQLALHLGGVAREARTRAGLTQEQTAERIGIATEVYGRLERGRILPSLPTLVKLCRVLSVEANSLLGFSSSKPPTWLARETPSENETPPLRRLLHTARGLKPRQLSVLGRVAGALLTRHSKRTAT